MPTMYLRGFLLAFLCVQHAFCQSKECQDMTNALMKYKDFAMEQYGGEMTRVVQTYFNINLESDTELQVVVCAVVDAEPKTIRNIARSTPMFNNERQLSFLYSASMHYFTQQLETSQQMVYYYGAQLDFFSVTGFPTWPLKLGRKELSKYINAVDSQTLQIFYQYSRYENGEDHIDRQALVEDLSDATSFIDFAKRAYLFRRVGLDIDDVTIVQEAQYVANDYMQSVESTRERVRTSKETLIHSTPLYDAMQRTGFLNVTRGGPVLYSCDFIADKAVKALGYAEEIFGSMMVRATLMHLGTFSDVEEFIRSKVCSLMHATSVKDVFALLPPTLIPYDQFKERFGYMTLTGQMLLVKPGEHMLLGMSILRLAETLEQVGYPDFPLSINTDQAKQIASFINEITGFDDDVDTLAQNVQDEASMRDMMARKYYMNVVEMLVGKTDTALSLASCLYQLLMSVEEQGVLMLRAQ